MSGRECEWTLAMSVRGPRYFISCDSSSQAWWVARFYEPQFCPYCGGKIVFRSTDERRPLVLKSLQRPMTPIQGIITLLIVALFLVMAIIDDPPWSKP